MYAATPDPYCYAGTTVLKNRAGLRDQAALDALEAVFVTQRLDEPLPGGRLTIRHYCSIHRHLFGDIYPWAGRFRSVRISKGSSMFCYPEHIGAELKRLFGRLHAEQLLRNLSRAKFAKAAAHFMAELNAIHAFREGNGRTQLAFLAVLANQAGYPIVPANLDPQAVLDAMIASFGGNEASLVRVIQHLTANSD